MQYPKTFDADRTVKGVDGEQPAGGFHRGFVAHFEMRSETIQHGVVGSWICESKQITLPTKADHPTNSGSGIKTLPFSHLATRPGKWEGNCVSLSLIWRRERANCNQRCLGLNQMGVSDNGCHPLPFAPGRGWQTLGALLDNLAGILLFKTPHDAETEVVASIQYP